ncbi:hypothetical protein [Sphingomonas morindae]|uniref:Antifreeze glycopeptide polyprotein n=1 Tax=Sphingomonas morindae TaxID=1541170 RepID=A0ABY4X5S0_9SPHN|nr:hypothetical protein [Sphingomonas morindae]USI72197.1 hypothetical protein LHA26_12925 [Sphingomonas morindae]
MRPSSKAGLALAVALGALLPGLPAQGQQSPQSILPPGFGDPTPPAPTAPARPAPAAPAAAPAAATAPPVPLAPPPPSAEQIDEAEQATARDQVAEAQAAAAAEALRKQDVPAGARRDLDRIGIVSPAVTGFAEDGFGARPGRYLATLMTRLDAPVASRWVAMLLRRALVTESDTPPGIDPADWVAARVALLARLGEADAARLLAQAVDSDRATPALRSALLDAALASADPAALCPVADEAEAAGQGGVWTLARAMCAGLAGESGTASALIDHARAGAHGVRGIDLLLAERVVGAGTNARRAPGIRWDQVDMLTPWRFGLGAALGFAIPDSLYDRAPLAMQAWRARAPMLPIAARLGAARIAATLGVLSAGDLIDAYAAAAEEGDPLAMDQSPAGRLRAAYAARDVGDRMAALRTLWTDPVTERDAYAGKLLTAYAAARIAPSADQADDAPGLIAAMLSAGLDLPAARWAPIAAGLRGTPGEEARALLAVGAPGSVRFDAGAVAGFGSGGRGAARLRAQLFFAGLAGLGRLDPARVDGLGGELGVPLASANSWTRAIDAAAARREPATVALLAATGMQTSDWTQVSPVFLYHIVAALRAVGLEPEARMIAAEALMRT